MRQQLHKPASCTAAHALLLVHHLLKPRRRRASCMSLGLHREEQAKKTKQQQQQSDRNANSEIMCARATQRMIATLHGT
jgi:hypothetical protein